MKTSAQIIGLPIISIADGGQIGTVKLLIINPEKGSVDFLTIEQEDVAFGLKAIPFKKIVGIGEFAVTVEDDRAVIDLAEIPIANQLVNKQIRIKNTKAMTRKGELLGEVTEFFINDETGEIMGIHLQTEGRQAILSSEWVLTYGKDILIVSETAPDSLLDDAGMLAEKIEAPIHEANEAEAETAAIEEIKEHNALKALREKQMELLQGKRVKKDILDLNGHILIKAGTILTAEHIVKAQTEGPSVMIDLSMNVDA
ncbi:photosystem reaction center subunit H [Anoxybacillus sp. UARK-01]|uniref:PRC-barrel domain-containing protein n=1 Tax=Anoxybacteroides rupiense TaxID=311460 RepID=A0ABD5IST6_9BACL|nr:MULTISPECIES: PRC-barrel domain-containing protein [Anoxybacillus]MED5051032.1 PRC-barrel domain-containing protein [Anoxybacillus rupiensis]OQM45705.1 photosystem reaction center subunit H [Anoxybacillus sp. UARK-01]